jgi:hypothetical protein
MFFIIYQRSTCFGRFFRPSSGTYKTVCASLGIVMLSWSTAGVDGLEQPIHTSGRHQGKQSHYRPGVAQSVPGS